MIISHTYRFIFLRTEKTAGTSTEFALAEICGPDDIATGISAGMAKRLGLNTAWSKRWSNYFPIRTGALRRSMPRLFGLHTHATAAQVKDVLPHSIFSSYFKFAVERNPWDRQVSLYYQRARQSFQREPDFNRDMNSLLYRALHHTRVRNWQVYTIKDQIVVDEVLPYENLAVELARIAKQLGLPCELELGHRRSGFRSSADYRGQYTEGTKRLIANWYRKEIAAFGYEF
jgi:hypothetical protein